MHVSNLFKKNNFKDFKKSKYTLEKKRTDIVKRNKLTIV